MINMTSKLQRRGKLEQCSCCSAPLRAAVNMFIRQFFGVMNTEAYSALSSYQGYPFSEDSNLIQLTRYKFVFRTSLVTHPAAGLTIIWDFVGVTTCRFFVPRDLKRRRILPRPVCPRRACFQSVNEQVHRYQATPHALKPPTTPLNEASHKPRQK